MSRSFGTKTRILQYLKRIGKARGFGIQSPWAFSFVTEVVGERLPYYAYKDIDSQYANAGERKFMKLMLRLRNFTYPHKVIVIDNINTMDDDWIDKSIMEAGTKGAIVVRGIWKDPESLNRWHALQQRDDVGITFDLYDEGIIFLDLDIYKQHYMLNF